MVDKALPAGWKLTALGAVANFINGDRSENYPTQADRAQSGVPFINTGHIEPTGRLTTTGMEYITRESFNRLRSGMVRQGDIVYCLRGSTIGKTARNHFAEGAIASSLVIVRAKEHCCQEYLYFCLTSPLGQKLVTQHDNGSAQPNLSVRVLSNYVLPLPPLPEQRAIAHILSTLDDKIELNRRMNETLEAIARAIFKSWFVEFDPVRTKMQGRKVLGIGYDIAALFPDTFQDSVLGEIPFGWNSTRLSGQMDILGGGTPKTTQPEYWNGTVPWISVADTAPGPYITRTEKRITNAGVEQSAAQLLPVETIVITARGTVGNTALTAGLMAMNQSCYGLRAKGQMGQLFLLYQVRHQLANLRANTHGSVFETITRSTFDSIEAIQPPDGLLVAYEQLARPLFDRILLNQGENETLVGLRDTLLPKLMSGEIRLSQGKKIVEARA